MVKEYIIENDKLKVTLLNYGGIIKSIIFKELQRECVVNYLDNKDYLDISNSIGVGLTGPFAGRIDNGSFNLDEKEIHLTKNFMGKHHLHGGDTPLGCEEFEVVKKQDDSIEFYKVINNKNTNYKDLKIWCSYELSKNSLIQEVRGESKEKVVFNPTNHTYFNFNSEKDILDYTLRVPSDKVWLLRDDFIPEKLVELEETSLKGIVDGSIGSCNRDGVEFSKTGYIDHPFLLNGRKIVLEGEGIKLEVEAKTSSTLVVYTGNVMDGIDGKMNVESGRRYMGVCLETQEVPNAINMDKERKKVIVKSDRPFIKSDIYTFSKV